MNLRLIQIITYVFLNISHTASAVESTSSPAHFGEEYSVNFMWLNSKPQLDQPHVCPGSDLEVKTKLLDGAIAWSAVNPRAIINVWFGSMNTSADAAQNTMDLMVRTPGTKNIRLRDIREISLVAENPRVFSSEIPVYFRVDLARAILLHDLVKNGESTYAVYGDLDMLPMSEAELFDEETVDNLKSFGLVMAKGGTGCGFENGFQITSHHNINMLNAINFAIIKQNIERGKIALEQGYFAVDGFHDGGFKENGYRIGGRQTTPMCGLHQIVYESYPDMFEYFYALDNCFKIDTCRMKGIDIKDVTHEHLGLSYINLRAISLAIPLEELLKIVNHNGLLKIPSKHVSLPGSAHKFNDGV